MQIHTGTITDNYIRHYVEILLICTKYTIIAGYELNYSRFVEVFEIVEQSVIQNLKYNMKEIIIIFLKNNFYLIYLVDI